MNIRKQMWKQTLIGSLTLALLIVLAPGGAKASVFDQKVVANFSGPVEIPGQVLPSGTYVIKVLNVWGSRDVVQVSNADESRVIATAFTIPRYRAVPTSHPVFVLQERGADTPQALQAWYYPGFTDGHQFVYSSHVAPALMASAPPPAPAPAEPAMTESQPVSNDESAPMMTAENNEPAPAAMPESTPAPQAQQATPQELPKTASDIPLTALIGTLLVAGAFGLKPLASRA